MNPSSEFLNIRVILSHPSPQTSQLVIMRYQLFYCLSCFNAGYVTKLIDHRQVEHKQEKKMKKKVLETQGDTGEAGVRAVTLD